MKCECGFIMTKVGVDKWVCQNGLCFKKFTPVECPECKEATRKLNITQVKVGLYSFVCTKCKLTIKYPVGEKAYI